MSAWVEMTRQRDTLMLYLSLLALMTVAFWRLALAGRQEARVIAYGGLCVGFFATLVLSWLLG